MPAAIIKTEFHASALGVNVTLLSRGDGGPIRPILNGRRARTAWNYYSMKNGFSLPCESKNELHALYHAEVSHHVVRYRVQPHTARFVVGNGLREYTPDLEETHSDGRVTITEVKEVFKEEADPAYAEKLRVARRFYEDQGMNFRILERADIEAQPVFDSVETIQAFRRTVITAADILQVRSVIGARESAPLSEVRDAFKTSALGFAKLAAMMVRRLICIDLERGLAADTPVRLTNDR